MMIRMKIGRTSHTHELGGARRILNFISYVRYIYIYIDNLYKTVLYNI